MYSKANKATDQINIQLMPKDCLKKDNFENEWKYVLSHNLGGNNIFGGNSPFTNVNTETQPSLLNPFSDLMEDDNFAQMM